MIWKVLESHPAGAPATRLIALANQKGGVGKTTTVVNLGAALALRGNRVLVVDVDPQANATTGLGIDPRSAAASTYHVATGEALLSEACVRTAVAGLDCCPGSRDLAGLELELVGENRRERRLADGLAGDSAHDFVLLDCPPSLGLLTINALVAADVVIVPVQCEYYALEGLGQLLEAAERVRAAFHPRLRVSGFLLTMYDARTRLSGQVSDEVRTHFGRLVFSCVVPRSIRLSEAPSYGEPVLTLDPGSRGAIAYRSLAAEIEARYGGGSVRPADGPRAAVPSGPAKPGPSGRGYGTTAPEPVGVDESFPRAAPWGSGT